MENGNQQYALAHFASVWERVGTTAEPSGLPGPSPTEPLTALIAAEAESVAHCAALAGRIGGSMGQCLAWIAKEKREHLCRLELELFLCSGMFCRQKLPPCRKQGVLTALRDAYTAEQALLRQYQAAQSAAQEPTLRKLYAVRVKAQLRYLETLRCLIRRMLGIL